MVKKAAQATPNRQLRAARKERGWTQQQVADRIGAPLSLNISRWENGTAFPSAYYIERLCQLFGKSVRELALSQLEDETPGEQTFFQATHLNLALHPLFEQEVDSSPSADQQDAVPSQTGPRVWMLPYPRNLFFLGREDVLALLQHQMQAGQTMAISQPQAISGLGGVGKTQVALEYAYRHIGDYQAVLWTRADSRDALVAGFLETAHAVNLPERDEPDQTVIVAAVKGWLSQHTSWLLILDNADELSLLPEFLPSPMRGHLLLTTRAQALGRLANRIEIETLDLDTAALLLLRRAGLLALDVSLAQAEQTDWQAAMELSGELGGLPLALDQAGAYLEETRCNLQDYLDLYRSHRVDLLRHRGALILDHPDSVATTWSLSFASIEQRSALAADLLRLCAVLHPDAIPDELFLQGATHLGPVLAAMETDPLAFNQALAVIQSYSLMRRNSREQMLSIHLLVQAVLQDAMTTQERDQWIERAIEALNAVFPEVIRDQILGQWGQCGRLLPHVLTTAAAATRQHHNLELASLLTKTADYLLQRAQYEQAEPLYLRALTIRQQQRGALHPETAESLHDYARLLELRNQPDRALTFYQQALAIREQRLGPEHPRTLDTRARNAHLLRACGRLEEAAALEVASARQASTSDQELL
jgi:transcriptional regulator with XRE-family HTH domain/tetratricopeptide (TPR) repeat protein